MSLDTRNHSGNTAAGNEAITPIRPGRDRDDIDEAPFLHTVSASKLLVPVLFVAILVAGIAVFFYLPDAVDKRQAGTIQSQQSSKVADSGRVSSQDTSAAGVPVKELAPWQTAQQIEARKKVQATLQQLLEKQKLLEAANVNLWAENEYAEAMAEAARGDELFVQHEYSAAQQVFTGVNESLQKLIVLKEAELQATLDNGQIALDEGDSNAAIEHFSLALKIDAQNQAAATGIKRAKNLDPLLTLLTAGRTLEEQGELRAAKEKYTQAVNLDEESESAGAALARINGKIINRQFNIAMTEGFSALDQGDYAAARVAFGRAGKLRPGSAEVAEALAQAESGQRLRTIATHRNRAEQFKQAENWKQAAEEYNAALALDANLVFAREGKAFSVERAAIMKRLSEYLQTPGRLASQIVHDEASAFLDSLERLEDKGPKLRQQMSQLAEQLRLAAIPIPVRLLSDNQTQVSVHRVGRFGTFTTKDLQLRPGTYTAVGSRPGYRDVRREFDVLPGKGPVSVSIKCEEPI